jgi:rhamnosyltransferase
MTIENKSGSSVKNAIAGVVVLYNPGREIIENINSYLSQVSRLYIVDNSLMKASYKDEILNKNSSVEYIFNNGNLGIAAALNIAVDKSIKAGYSFLLTMDQDSYFEEGALSNLISVMSDTNLIGIYSPFHKNKYFTNPPTTNGLEEVSDVMTSGNILNLSAAEGVGKFKEGYFIDYVDIEYCLRLRKNGYKIIRVNGSFLIHNEADISKVKLLGKTTYPPNYSSVRWYYKIRNYLYLKQEYKKLFKEYFKVERKNIRNNILKVFLLEKNKIIKIRMMLKGYIHFHKNITGRFSS